MKNLASIIDFICFVVLPYVAITLLILKTTVKFRTQKYSITALSSQFLESRTHFWGLMPFHIGILIVLLGHLVAFLVPRSILDFNSHPLRLYILEVSALIFALLALFGIIGILYRRKTILHVRVITSKLDWVVYIIIMLQIVSGIWVAVAYPWGSSWFASTMTPYLKSVFFLNPDLTFVSQAPHMVKFHIVNAWLFIGLFPFTRLLHVFTAPIPYYWRRVQMVRWYRYPQRNVTH